MYQGGTEQSHQEMRCKVRAEENQCINRYQLRGGSAGKESPCNAGDAGLIPEWGRSPGEGNGGPFHYSCLGNPMDKGAWWVPSMGLHKSQMQLND